MSLTNSKLNDYLYRSDSGTAALKSFIAGSIYTGDTEIEDKLVSYHLFWKFYDDKHWSKSNDKFINFNWTKAVIDKLNRYTLGKEAFSFNVEDNFGEEIPEELEKAFEMYITTTWAINKKKVLSSEMFQMGSVAGDLFVFVYPDIKSKVVRLKILDSRYVIPLFEGGDKNKLNGYKYVIVLAENPNKYTQKVTEYYSNKVVTYNTKSTEKDAKKYDYTETETNLNIIPIVHIHNSVNSGGWGGISDAATVVKLNKTYNEMAQDVKEIVDYYTTPVTIITGALVGNLKRGIGEVWSGLPAEANVQTLSLGENLSANMEYLKTIREAIHDLSGVPQEVLSKVQHISNTSAAALKMMYHSMTMAADAKTVTYGEGIEEINSLILQYAIKFFTDHDLVKPLVIAIAKSPSKSAELFLERYRITPVFKYGLPNDRMSVLNEGQIEIQLGIGSKRTIMERLGVKNIPLVLEEAKKDKEEVEEDKNKNKDKKPKVGIAQEKLLED